MIPEVIGVALLLGWITRGKFSRLADIQIERSWLILVAFGSFLIAQVVVKRFSLGSESPFIPVLLHATSIVSFIALAFANRKIPGAWLILIGLVLNAVAIAANGGYMPATREALDIVMGENYLEQEYSGISVKHCIADSNTKLLFLTDIIPLPRPYLLLKGVFSIGDIIMTSGIFIAIISIMRRPLPSEKKVLEEA